MENKEWYKKFLFNGKESLIKIIEEYNLSEPELYKLSKIGYRMYEKHFDKYKNMFKKHVWNIETYYFMVENYPELVFECLFEENK